MASGIGFGRRALAASALAASLACGAPLLAQDGSRAVVQALPPPEAGQLSAALQRLAADPRDLDALLAAGNASLKLDDTDAALGFFARAEEIAPGDARTKAGLAATMVRDENPFEALRLFDEAERAGARLDDLASERALAYDLVGDNAHAQELYRAVLARGEDAEASRRLAISLAISGDQAGMERILLPMLQRRDLAAYRARAFALAILGKVDDATTISDAVMPKSMAAKIAPYLRYMPRLTHAQQAAAANLGNFPRTADIGRDDARVAQYAGGSAEAPPVRTADARLVPAGEPLGPSAATAPATDEERRRPDRPAKPQKLKGTGGRGTVTYLPQEPAPEPQPDAAPDEPAARAETAPTQIALAEPPPPGPSVSLDQPQAVAVPPSSATPAPAFDLAQVAGSRNAAPAPASPAEALAAAAPEPEPQVPAAQLAVAEPEPEAETPAPEAAAAEPEPAPQTAVTQVAAAEVPRPLPAAPQQVLNGPAGTTATPAADNFAGAFADFDFALSSAAPAAGAVDLSTISAPRERAVKEPPKPARPLAPARHWVQLATGRDRARLGSDFKRIASNSKGLLKDARGYLADWGETNRLLTGPFKTDAAAQAFVTKLDDAGIKAFTFSSEAGEDVSALPAR